MTTNIQKILTLFPDKNSSRSSPDRLGITITGPAPLAALSPELLAVVNALRGDVRWGRVWQGDLSGYASDHSDADLALCGELARRGVTIHWSGLHVIVCKTPLRQIVENALKGVFLLRHRTDEKIPGWH